MALPNEKPPHFIRAWRQHRNLTLEQLAERIEMTHQNLGKIERFLVPYSQPVLESLADALSTDPASLIMRDPSDPEGLWSVWDRLAPSTRPAAVRLLNSLAEEDKRPATNVEPIRRTIRKPR